MAEPSHVAFSLCSLPCYALLAPNLSASFFPLPEPSPSMPFFVPWLSSLPPGNLHGFPLVICTLSAPSRGEIYLQHNPVTIAYSYLAGGGGGSAHVCGCGRKVKVGQTVPENFLCHRAASCGSRVLLTRSSVWTLLYSALYYSCSSLHPDWTFRILERERRWIHLWYISLAMGLSLS